jgi:uncharacterized protein YkwD
VARTLSILATAIALLGLAGAPSAIAAGLDQQRVVEAHAQAPERAGSLIAPAAACPSQSELDAPPQAQVETMRCLTDFARRHAGLGTLADAEALDASARGKSGDILRCDSFSHFACGRDFTYWMQESGYLDAQCWRAGENLAWGTGREGGVRSIFQAWMRSPGHRQNVLGDDFTQLGVSLRVGALDGQRGTHVWTQHFGSHCESPTVG